jgi:putative glutamine amidotransferase
MPPRCARRVCVRSGAAAQVSADPVGFLARFDGLLLSGGPDIHPAAYPNPPSFPGEGWDAVLASHEMYVDESRDALELALVRAALAMKRPILGICRGFQVVNVALGGQLILNIDSCLGHRAQPDGASSWHPIHLDPRARLARVLGSSGAMRVNSRHHQGVTGDLLGEGLSVAATAEDGVIIEAIEATDHPWVVGVQWHPERIQDEECHRASRPLFAAFVRACGL